MSLNSVFLEQIVSDEYLMYINSDLLEVNLNRSSKKMIEDNLRFVLRSQGRMTYRKIRHSVNKGLMEMSGLSIIPLENNGLWLLDVMGKLHNYSKSIILAICVLCIEGFDSLSMASLTVNQAKLELSRQSKWLLEHQREFVKNEFYFSDGSPNSIAATASDIDQVFNQVCEALSVENIEVTKLIKRQVGVMSEYMIRAII